MKLFKDGKLSDYIGGGIIEGDKLGLIGEYTGTNAEIIAPLTKLKQIIMKDIIAKDIMVQRGGTGMDIDVAG